MPIDVLVDIFRYFYELLIPLSRTIAALSVLVGAVLWAFGGSNTARALRGRGMFVGGPSRSSRSSRSLRSIRCSCSSTWVPKAAGLEPGTCFRRLLVALIPSRPSGRSQPRCPKRHRYSARGFSCLVVSLYQGTAHEHVAVVVDEHRIAGVVPDRCLRAPVEHVLAVVALATREEQAVVGFDDEVVGELVDMPD